MLQRINLLHARLWQETKGSTQRRRAPKLTTSSLCRRCSSLITTGSLAEETYTCTFEPLPGYLERWNRVLVRSLLFIFFSFSFVTNCWISFRVRARDIEPILESPFSGRFLSSPDKALSTMYKKQKLLMCVHALRPPLAGFNDSIYVGKRQFGLLSKNIDWVREMPRASHVCKKAIWYSSPHKHRLEFGAHSTDVRRQRDDQDDREGKAKSSYQPLRRLGCIVQILIHLRS